MKNTLFICLFSLVVLFTISACDQNKDIDNQTSQIQLRLIDAPGDYLEVNVEIIDIQYNNNEGAWKSFDPVDGYPINVDLTDLIAGNDLLLVDEIIPSGNLDQIRLVLSDNNSLVIQGDSEGETISTHLDTPSAQQSGLKIKLDTDLKPGFSYTFILDWDVQKSVVKAGNSDKYNLKPVIRANTVVNSGSITGKVVGDVEGDGIEDVIPLKNAVIKIYDNENLEIASTFSDDNGLFMVQGLDPGDYTIKISHLDFVIYEPIELITVEAGEIFQLGTIELSVPLS